MVAERPSDPDALDLLLRGKALFSSAGTLESYSEVRRLFERAVELDPGSADAQTMLAHILMGLWSMGWPEDRDGVVRRAEEHVGRALALDPRHARAHYVRGVVEEARRRFELAVGAFDLAAELNPNYVFVHARRGWVLNLTDRPEEAVAEFRRAMAISPREPGIGSWHNGLAMAGLMLGRDQEALGHALRAVTANPGFHYAHLLHAGSLALVGRAEEARGALGEYLRLRPSETVASLRRAIRERTGHPLYLATWDRLADALRSVGLPDE
jgi:adenylate cyclase